MWISFIFRTMSTPEIDEVWNNDRIVGQWVERWHYPLPF